MIARPASQLLLVRHAISASESAVDTYWLDSIQCLDTTTTVTQPNVKIKFAVVHLALFAVVHVTLFAVEHVPLFAVDYVVLCASLHNYCIAAKNNVL